MNSFKFSTRHLLVVVAAAAFVFWLVKNYYDSQKLAESQAQLRAAKIAGSRYLYNQLLSDESVIGKNIAEYPGLDELSVNPKKFDDHELVARAIKYGVIVRPAPATPAHEASAQQDSAEETSADAQQAPAVTYVSGDRVLGFYMDDGTLLIEGRYTTGFWLYIRNGKILAIFDAVAYATY